MSIQTPAHETGENAHATVHNSIVSGTEIPKQSHVGVCEPQEKYLDSIQNECDIERHAITKPSGGLWTATRTPTGNLFSDDVEFHNSRTVYDVECSADSRVLVVDSDSVLSALPTYTRDSTTVVDFEQLFTMYGIDGVFFTQSIIDSHDSKHDSPTLQKWDFESCVWNTVAVFESITESGVVERN